MDQAGPGSEDEVTVLVVDRDVGLAAAVRRACDGIAPRPAVVTAPRLHTAAGEMRRTGVLVAGPSALAGGLDALAALHLAHPSTVILLAWPPADNSGEEKFRFPEHFLTRPGSLREIVRCGADDLIDPAMGDDELMIVLERAVGGAARRRRPGADAEAGGSRGRVVAFTSPTGGAGKTFLATNAAAHLARRATGRVVLVDLDLQFGEVRTSLRVKADASIADAVRAEADGATTLAEVLPELLVDASGFDVLCAPKDPAEADGVTGADIHRVIEALRHLAATVVIDAPAGLGEHVLAALDLADEVVAIATPDRPSLHNLARFTLELERHGVAGRAVRLALNKFEAGAGIDRDELAERFPDGFAATIPYSPEVVRSVNFGTPVVRSGSSTGRAVAAALDGLLREAASRPVRACDPIPAARPVTAGQANPAGAATPQARGPVTADEPVSAGEPTPHTVPAAEPTPAPRLVPAGEPTPPARPVPAGEPTPLARPVPAGEPTPLARPVPADEPNPAPRPTRQALSRWWALWTGRRAAAHLLPAATDADPTARDAAGGPRPLAPPNRARRTHGRAAPSVCARGPLPRATTRRCPRVSARGPPSIR